MKNEFYFPSKEGTTNIHAMEWKPEGEVKAVLQICHGMVEHIERYDAFAEFLASHGFYVVGHSHLGHGLSVTGPEKKGFFHEKNGNAYVIADIHQLRIRTEKQYPNLPYFIMGHSMGSFLVRQYLGLYGTGLAGAIIMGTGDMPNVVLEGGRFLCKMISVFKGWDYRSTFVDGMACGGYSKAYAHVNDGTSWLCKDVDIVRKYKEDPNCGFIFTVNAYYHMFSGMIKMNKQEAAKKIPKNIPVFFVAGADDPVGNKGKSVEKVYNRYWECGLNDVTLKLYEGDRHEILNELDKDVVYKDILTWLENKK